MSEMSYDAIAAEATDRMGKAVGHLESDLKGIRTGRATPGLVLAAHVDHPGAPLGV